MGGTGFVKWDIRRPIAVGPVMTAQSDHAPCGITYANVITYANMPMQPVTLVDALNLCALCNTNVSTSGIENNVPSVYSDGENHIKGTELNLTPRTTFSL